MTMNEGFGRMDSVASESRLQREAQPYSRTASIAGARSVRAAGRHRSNRTVFVGVAYRSHQCQTFCIGDVVKGDVKLQRGIGHGVELARGVFALLIVLFEVKQIQYLVVNR